MRSLFLVIFLLTGVCGTAAASNPPSKAKFYDFSEQLINGEIKKPTALYTDARQKVKFERLLRLKKSFMREMLTTAKDPVFK